MAVLQTITASTMSWADAPISAQAAAASSLSASVSRSLQTERFGGPTAGVHQAGDDVLAISDLRVHCAALGQCLAGCQVNDVRRDLGRADIDGKPEPGRVDPD